MMIKYILIMMVVPLLAIGCGVRDSAYYRTHIADLQKIIRKCPDHPAGVSCKELHDCALNANKLADELRYDPQGFGHTILSLQEKCGNNRRLLQNTPDDITLKNALSANEQELGEHLAVVKWLESPKA